MSAFCPIFGFEFCLIENQKKNQMLKTLQEPSRRGYYHLTMNTSIFIPSYQHSPQKQHRFMGWGEKIMVGTVVKTKVGESEEEIRELFSRRLKKYLTSVFQGVYRKKTFLVRFQYGCEYDLTSNKLTVVTIEKSPVTEEPGVTRIAK